MLRCPVVLGYPSSPSYVLGVSTTWLRPTISLVSEWRSVVDLFLSLAVECRVGLTFSLPRQRITLALCSFQRLSLLSQCSRSINRIVAVFKVLFTKTVKWTWTIVWRFYTANKKKNFSKFRWNASKVRNLRKIYSICSMQPPYLRVSHPGEVGTCIAFSDVCSCMCVCLSLRLSVCVSV